MSDYISKEWIKNAIHNFFRGLNHTVTEEDIQAYLDATPNADVSENIHGEWTRHTRVEPVYSIDGVKTWGVKCQCNQCTFTTIVVEDFGYYRYCPNCGADMRGE